MLTFRRETPGVLDPLTDTYTDAVDTTITGTAIEVRGKPDEYAPLGLDITTIPTLLFTPSSYPLRAHTPEFVLPGDRVTYNGVDYTTKAVYPVAPDGNVIIARIVVGV